MAHNLDFQIASNGAQQARFRHAQAIAPWHGFSNPITPGETLDQIAESIGADIDPIALDMRVTFVDPVTSQAREMTVPGHRAIVDRYGRILSVMSDGYKIHSPKAIIGFFKDYFEAADLGLSSIGFLDNGGIMFAQAIVPHEAKIKDEILSRYVFGVTSFNGKLATDFRQADTAIVCQNTLMAALGENKRGARIKHSTALTPEVLSQAKRLLGESEEHTSRLTEIGEQLAETPLTRDETMILTHWLAEPKWFKKRAEENGSELLKRILETEDSRAIVSGLLEVANREAKEVTQILSDAPGINDLSRVGSSILTSISSGPGADLDARRDTAWGMLQGVTHYVDHVAGRNRDTALQSAWFGVGQGLKTQTLEMMRTVSEIKGIGKDLESAINTTISLPSVSQDLGDALAATENAPKARTRKGGKA